MAISRTELKKLLAIFKVHDKPFDASEGQLDIAESIVNLTHPRTQIIAPTQYGKSLVIALAVILRSIGYGENFTVIAPSEKKAQIIMGYIIEHLFDDEMFIDQLEFEENTTYSSQLEILKRYRSKDHISFKDGGGVRTLTLNARTKSNSIEAAMGFGGNRLILDESSLIDDSLYATVKRMLGGFTEYDETFLLEIGNPFYRNHFHRTWNGDLYNKVFIDYHQALKEGRYSPEFIEEMRSEAFFDIFYECLFPRADEIDDKGYRRLFTIEELAKLKKKHKPTDEELQFVKLGVDVGAGGDYNTFIIRTNRHAWVEKKNRSSDTMVNVKEVQDIMFKYPNLKDEDIFIDDIGVGKGVTDRLKELGIKVNPVTAGAKARDSSRYMNVKAENYWALKEWLDKGNTVDDDEVFNQITWIKYKISSDKQIQIEPKDQLRKDKGKSPDFAEGLMLTFSVAKKKPKVYQHKPF